MHMHMHAHTFCRRSTSWPRFVHIARVEMRMPAAFMGPLLSRRATTAQMTMPSLASSLRSSSPTSAAVPVPCRRSLNSGAVPSLISGEPHDRLLTGCIRPWAETLWAQGAADETAEGSQKCGPTSHHCASSLILHHMLLS